MSLFDQLPDEVLLHILNAGCQDHPKFRLTGTGELDEDTDWDVFQFSLHLNRRMPKDFASLAMRVCVRWRELITTTSHLYLTRLWLENSGWQDMCAEIAALASALRESRGSDLDIQIWIQQGSLPQTRRLLYWGLTMIAKHARQIRCIRVICERSDPALDLIIALISQSAHISSFIAHLPDPSGQEDGADSRIDHEIYSLYLPFSKPAPNYLSSIGYLLSSIRLLSIIPVRTLKTLMGLAVEDEYGDWDSCMRMLAACSNISILSLVGLHSPRNMDRTSVDRLLPKPIDVSLSLLHLRTLHLAIGVRSTRGFFQHIALPSLERLVMRLNVFDESARIQLPPSDHILAIELPSLRYLQIQTRQFDTLPFTPVLKCTSPLDRLSLIVNRKATKFKNEGSQPPISLPASREVVFRGVSMYETVLLIQRLEDTSAIKILRITPDAYLRSHRATLRGVEGKLPTLLHILEFRLQTRVSECRDLFAALYKSGEPKCLELDCIDSRLFDEGGQWEDICRQLRYQAALSSSTELKIELPPYRTHSVHLLQDFQNVKTLTLTVDQTRAWSWSILSWIAPISTNLSDPPLPRLKYFRLLVVTETPVMQRQQRTFPTQQMHLGELKERLNALIQSRKDCGCSLASVVVECTRHAYGRDSVPIQTLMVLDQAQGIMQNVSTPNRE